MSEVTPGPFSNWTVGRMVPMPASLPSGWKVMRLTHVARLESGHTPSRRRPEYWGGEIPWLSLNDIANLGKPSIANTLEKITPLGLANSSARLLPTGTVIFSRTASVGKATILEIPMATTQDFANFVCGPEVHNGYLMFLFRFLQATWKQLMAGSTHNTIYMPVFKRLQVLLPPYSEQQAIAQALSEADALIASLEELIAKKRDIMLGAKHELLTGRSRLNGFTGKWKTMPLGQLGLWRGGATPSMQRPEFWEGGTIPWASSADVRVGPISTTSYYITDRALKESSTSLAPVGSILLVTRSGILRRFLPVGMAVVPIAINQDIKALVPSAGVESDFAYHAIVAASEDILGSCMKSGTTVESIELAWLKKFEIGLPATLDEQRAIADILNDMDAEIVALEDKLGKARSLKQGMMQALMTGEDRLV